MSRSSDIELEVQRLQRRIDEQIRTLTSEYHQAGSDFVQGGDPEYLQRERERLELEIANLREARARVPSEVRRAHAQRNRPRIPQIRPLQALERIEAYLAKHPFDQNAHKLRDLIVSTSRKLGDGRKKCMRKSRKPKKRVLRKK